MPGDLVGADDVRSVPAILAPCAASPVVHTGRMTAWGRAPSFPLCGEAGRAERRDSSDV